jgi:hypothetical protein
MDSTLHMEKELGLNTISSTNDTMSKEILIMLMEMKNMSIKLRNWADPVFATKV